MIYPDSILLKIQNAAEHRLTTVAASELLASLLASYQQGSSTYPNGELMVEQMYKVIDNAVPGLPEGAHLEIALIAMDYILDAQHWVTRIST